MATLYMERTLARHQNFWFVLIMAGGNINMSLYVLPQLFRWPRDEPASAFFRQKAA
jgi:hypothetical protein